MKISVAMCTYNGESFLRKQIDSILNQTIPVNEIIICDDRSTDETQNILAEYKYKFPSIFKIYINEKNLRSVKNFEKAISLCTGEIIFLSDQDDVWEENKAEVFTNYFQNMPKINAICSDGTAIDDNEKIINQRTIWSVPKLLKENDIDVDYFNIIAFIENIATGAGMAFRKSIVRKVLPIPTKDGFHHDEWIALLTSYEKSFMMIDEKLFRYRIHDNQQVGGVLYKNDSATAKRLVNHFDLFSDEKTFLQYKKFLKRLSESYKKHKALSMENDSNNIYVSKEIMMRCVDLFKHHQKIMRSKFPLKFFILSIADLFNNKRKIK